MKRIRKLLAALIVLALLCPACTPSEPEPEYRTDVDVGPVTVLIDVDFDSNQIEPSAQKIMRGFAKTIKELGGPSSVKLEYPPASGTDRENYLTRLRTELMAGKGPDVIICTGGFGFCANMADLENPITQEEALFKFPWQAMDNRFFLPLDRYIENARFMEWDKLTPVVMEAGKTSRGQMLLPMAYTLPVTVFDRNEYTHELSTTSTYDEMLSGDEHIRLAAAHDSIYQTMAFRDLIDYEKDKLKMTEEEYLDYVRTWVEIKQSPKTIVSDGLYLGVRLTDQMEEMFEDGFSMVPLYCREGGYGASITTFGAVNANTQNPAGAFFILDYLMSKEGQRSQLFGHILLGSSIPTYEGIMQQEEGMSICIYEDSKSAEYWSMEPQVYEEFSKVRDSISWARFRSSIEQTFHKPGGTFLYSDSNTKSLEDLVHESYMLMNMMLAES